MLLYIGLVVVIFLILHYSQASTKGRAGERIVARQAKSLGKDYVLLNNITLPNRNGGTAQIDHIVLSPYGIFVLETKHYRGDIYGKEDQKQWEQKFVKSSYKFYNPITQNRSHVNILSHHLLGLADPTQTHSIVIFTGKCRLRSRVPPYVFNGRRWLRYVRKQFRDVVYTEHEVQMMKERIESVALEDTRATDKQHKKYAKKQKRRWKLF